LFLPHITEPVSENPEVNTDLMIQECNPQMLYYFIHSYSPSAVKYLAKAGSLTYTERDTHTKTHTENERHTQSLKERHNLRDTDTQRHPH